MMDHGQENAKHIPMEYLMIFLAITVTIKIVNLKFVILSIKLIMISCQQR